MMKDKISVTQCKYEPILLLLFDNNLLIELANDILK